MLKNLLLATALAGVAAIATDPAYARLQLTVSDGTQTFSCFDGEGACDTNGGTNALSIVNPFTDGTDVTFTLTQSSFGKVNELQLSSSGISVSAARDITFVASDTSFVNPITGVRESSSLTFNSAIGSGASTLKFWADPANTQGANPSNTPGPLLFTATGTPVTDPDSFDGTHFSSIVIDNPFSMTEGASLNLIAGSSVTGFNESMQSSVPEPSTWAMLVTGFGLIGLVGLQRRRKGRELAI